MQWPCRKQEEPRDETKRFVARFLLWPKTIAGVTRWLERAVWLEQYLFADHKWYPRQWHGRNEDSGTTFPRGNH